MTINYGKRSPGGLAAANPGDTLYIPFSSYNDSGDSEALSGLAVTDIEVFKNGGVTARATDSGYSILTDTGQYGNRIGAYRIQLDIYNTTDDTGFYDAGSQYHVLIDAVTIDGKTVRFFPAVFEVDGVRSGGPSVGLPQVDVERIDGDTGSADVIGKFGQQLSSSGTLDTGTGVSDTGVIVNAVWNSVISDHVADTGSFGYAQGRLMAVNGDTGAAHLDAGRLGVSATVSLDTGQMNQAVWQADASRTLTAFAFDTGIQQALSRVDTGLSETIDRILADTDTGHKTLLNQIAADVDTGLRNTTFNVNLEQIDGDTGPADNLGRIAADTGTGSYLYRHRDTGGIADAIWAKDTRTLTAFAFDTGIQQALSRVDTGLSETIDRIFSHTDTGIQVGLTVNVDQIIGDTGAARHLAQLADEYDTGRLPAEATASLDTGALHAAIWQVPSGNANRTLTNIDTGAAIHLAQMADEHDTGRLQAEASATLDTGAVNQAVWQADALRTITNIDTGAAIHLAQMADEYDTGRLPAEASATLDTGAIANAIWDGLRADHTAAGSFGEHTIADVDLLDGDTGAADRLGKFAGLKLNDSGTLDTGSGTPGGAAASLDTGAVNQAVWQADAARQLTAFAFDTGIQQALQRVDTGLSETIDRILADTDTGVKTLLNQIASDVDTGLRNTTFSVNVEQIDGDTGPADNLGRIVADTGTGSYLYRHRDTGGIADAIWAKDNRSLTAFAFDTGIQQALQRVDTGLSETIDRILADTDTGITNRLSNIDTGLSETIDKILADTDTGLKTGLNVTASAISDTGINGRLATITTNLATVDTVADAIKAQTDLLTFDTGGNELHADIRKVANVQIQGAGDTGTGDTWRPI